MGSYDMDNSQYPIVDITDTSPVNSKRLLEVIRRYGFLYLPVKASPFQGETIVKQFALARRFFQLETSVKKAFLTDDKSRGWVGVGHETLDVSKARGEQKEAFNIGEMDQDGNPQQKLPDILQADLQQLRKFEGEARATCNQVLTMLAKGLEIEEGSDWLVQQHGRPSHCITRFLHYPTVSKEDQNPEGPTIRAGAHFDWGSLSLLFQRPQQSGLEVLSDGGWSSVPVYPPGWSASDLPPIVVIAGEWTDYWTGGLLKSTVHRVTLPDNHERDRDRYSMVYFCQPRDDVVVRTINSPLVQNQSRDARALDGSDQNSRCKPDSLEGLTSDELFMRRLIDSRA